MLKETPILKKPTPVNGAKNLIDERIEILIFIIP